MPGAQAVVVKLVAVPHTPPSQMALAPDGDAEPDKVTELAPHTNVCVLPALATGVDKLLVTVATAVLVQPFAGLVTVKV
jgi:hypothetical protein